MGKLSVPSTRLDPVLSPPPLPDSFYNYYLIPPLTKGHHHLILMRLITLLPILQTTCVPPRHLTNFTHTSPTLDEVCVRQSTGC